jgi:hypothetical protein
MSFDTEAARSFRRKFDVDTELILPYSVAVLAGLLLVECLVFVTVPAATGYETSLVEAFPLSFWLLFYTVLLGGIGVLLGAAVIDHRYWPHGLALTLANYALFLFLPAARGYRLYGRGTGDILRHLGDVEGILGSGSLPGVWYPGTHVLMAEFRMLGVPEPSLQYVFAVLFTALHIAGIGVLVRLLWGRQEGLSIGLVAAVPLVYVSMHVSARPVVNSFLLVPVVAVLFERYRRGRAFENVWLLVILGLYMIYTHPMTTLLVSALLGLTAVYSTIHGRYVDSVPTVSPRLAVVFPVLLFSWISTYTQFTSAVSKLFVSDDGSSPGAVTTQQATEVTFTAAQLAVRFVQLYGTVALYGATAGLLSLLTVKRLFDGTADYEWGVSSAQFGLGVGIAGAFVANSLIVGNIVRASRYALLFAVVVIALGLLDRLAAGDKRTAVAIVLVVVATAVVGVNATYEPNRHLTHSEYDGTEYLLTNSPESDIYNADTGHKAEEYILGTNDPGLYPEQMPEENAVPRGLGYDTPETTAADTFGDAMLVTKTYDMQRHTASYYTDAQEQFLFLYGPDSVERLGDDPTANRVYTNGGFEGWDIQPPETAAG